MKKLFTPKNEIELALIKGILEGEGIPYFVKNEHFGSMLGGPLQYKFNEKTVMVDEIFLESARELLRLLSIRTVE